MCVSDIEFFTSPHKLYYAQTQLYKNPNITRPLPFFTTPNARPVPHHPHPIHTKHLHRRTQHPCRTPPPPNPFSSHVWYRRPTHRDKLRRRRLLCDSSPRTTPPAIPSSTPFSPTNSSTTLPTTLLTIPLHHCQLVDSVRLVGLLHCSAGL